MSSSSSPLLLHCMWFSASIPWIINQFSFVLNLVHTHTHKHTRKNNGTDAIYIYKSVKCKQIHKRDLCKVWTWIRFDAIERKHTQIYRHTIVNKHTANRSIDRQNSREPLWNPPVIKVVDIIRCTVNKKQNLTEHDIEYDVVFCCCCCCCVCEQSCRMKHSLLLNCARQKNAPNVRSDIWKKCQILLIKLAIFFRRFGDRRHDWAQLNASYCCWCCWCCVMSCDAHVNCIFPMQINHTWFRLLFKFRIPFTVVLRWSCSFNESVQFRFRFRFDDQWTYIYIYIFVTPRAPQPHSGLLVCFFFRISVSLFICARAIGVYLSFD